MITYQNNTNNSQLNTSIESNNTHQNVSTINET